MALLESLLVKKPHFSNKNLSQKRRFTAMQGPLYVPYVEEVLPGDTFHIKVYGSLKTYPLKAPLMGSFRQQVAFFFVPTRLYTQEMDVNRLEFTPNSVDFPYFQLTAVGNNTSVMKPETSISQVKKSSLLDCLGVSAGTIDLADNGVAPFGKLNATPVIGYYDIFRNYYANTQESSYYVCASANRKAVSNWLPQRLSGIDDFVMDFVKGQRNVRANTATLQSLGFDPIQASCSAPLGGLVLSTHRPDMFTAWLSRSNYDDMVQSSVINVDNNIVTVNQIRLQSRILEYYERGLVSGGRYDDWVEAEFGIKTNKKLCIPEYLGSAYSDVLFDEVVSTTNISSDPTDPESQGPLGSLGGRGVGSLDSRTFHFTASENGYLMAIFTITPNVMHSSGILPLFFKTDYQSLYAPVFSGLGFQPLPVKYFFSMPGINTPIAPESTVLTKATTYNSLGYQPAWTEYTTAVDRVSGDFGAVGTLDYWVLTRKPWIGSVVKYDGPTSGANSTQYPTTEVFGVSKVNTDSPLGQSTTGFLLPTSYVLPQQFTLPFADQSPIAENFLVSLGFDVRARRAMPKHVMPSLS